jgi:hypothetical protein
MLRATSDDMDIFTQIYYAYIQIHHKYIVSTLKYIQILL